MISTYLACLLYFAVTVYHQPYVKDFYTYVTILQGKLEKHRLHTYFFKTNNKNDTVNYANVGVAFMLRLV